MSLDYSVEIKGKKVDIVYKTSDESFLRNFLKHVMETSNFEDLSIRIRGPADDRLAKVDPYAVTTATDYNIFDMDSGTTTTQWDGTTSETDI